MAVSLKTLAARAKDLYFQDYAPRDAFFDVGDFMLHAAAYYSDALNKMYQIMRKDGIAEMGFSNTPISAAWLMEEVLPVTPCATSNFFFAQPSSNIFSFDFDAAANAINGVSTTGKCCGGKKFDVIKIQNNEIRFLSLSPVTSNVYYWLAPNNRIEFSDNVTEVRVWYIPEVLGNNENSLLSDNIAADVIKNTLQLMFGAKQGNVIQEANDGNKNLVLPQQVNPNLGKQGN